MRRATIGVGVLVITLAMAVSGVQAVYADEQHQCFFESIQATFKAETSAYRVVAVCKRYTPMGLFQESASSSMRWISQGTYDPRTGIAREDISVISYNHTGTVTTTLLCPSDPWLGPSLQPGMVVCTNPTFTTSGGDEYVLVWFQYLQKGFYSTNPPHKIGSLPNSTGFQYNRAELIAQRDAVAKAEAAAALARTNKRLQQGAPRVQPVLGPTIQLGTPGPPYLSSTSVPIKIDPPQGLVVTGYLVRIERRNAQGVWTLVTNLPVSAAEASSPAGYLGWGAPGPGRGAPMIAGPGAYRVSAQVSAPRPTAWSLPVEFVVTAPKQAIQKGPKLFGQ